jgi:hypothetical protein
MFLDATKTEIKQKLQEVDKSKGIMEELLTAIKGHIDIFIETMIEFFIWEIGECTSQNR